MVDDTAVDGPVAVRLALSDGVASLVWEAPAVTGTLDRLDGTTAVVDGWLELVVHGAQVRATWRLRVDGRRHAPIDTETDRWRSTTTRLTSWVVADLGRLPHRDGELDWSDGLPAQAVEAVAPHARRLGEELADIRDGAASAGPGRVRLCELLLCTGHPGKAQAQAERQLAHPGLAAETRTRLEAVRDAAGALLDPRPHPAG